MNVDASVPLVRQASVALQCESSARGRRPWRRSTSVDARAYIFLHLSLGTMKFFLSILLLAAVALAQTDSAPPAQSIPVDQSNVRKAKAVLNQTIQALGGQAYLNIQDISQEGRSYSFYHGRPNSLGILFWRFYKFPDKDRIELTKQRDVIYVYKGDKGYQITYKGSQPQDPKDLAEYLRRRHFSLDWVLRKWLSEPGVGLFYEGQTVTEEKPVEQVTVMNAKNEGVTLYLSTDDHLPVKKAIPGGMRPTSNETGKTRSTTITAKCKAS